jgi:prolyl-tRNA editing enzyme YbaK/EbsC (Cys-tRNA(Pro) deacylase)/GNAT superfamily N-acetyltransferase
MIDIRTLTELRPEDLRRLNMGYSSRSKYIVEKTEAPQRTTISLELRDLGHPYIKRWATEEEDIARGQRLVSHGLSLGAYDGEEMVGIALAEPRPWNRSLWVWEFHIAETHQRMGIGRRLMGELIEKTRSAGLRVLVCETQNTNVPAISFYRAMGFEIDGIDLSYYTNEDMVQGEIAIFMKRKIEKSTTEEISTMVRPSNASAQKVQEVLRTKGYTLQVVELPDSTRTAVEAADAIGCQVGQIVKSLIFRRVETNRPILVLASGTNRVNEKKVGQMLGETIGKADADFVRQHTGFAIGGVPPVGHAEPISTFIDEDLLEYEQIWAAAGTPHAVFGLSPADLEDLTGGRVINIT